MKPNFALNFSHDDIGLLHRTAQGWIDIGVAALDAPDLGDALNYLRRSALGLSPAGVTTKLIIPNSQVLYITIDAPGPDVTSRRAQIVRALDGRTPYDVGELAFDWSGTGPQVQVAVVARETLAEAEQFTAQYRFNPVSFVAMPTADQFEGEPFFGPTAHAATVLAAGEAVERDDAPMVILSRDSARHDPLPEADLATPEPEPVPEPDLAPEPDPAPPPVIASADPVAELPLETAAIAATIAETDQTPPDVALPAAEMPAPVADVTAPAIIDPQIVAPQIIEDAPDVAPSPGFASRRNADAPPVRADATVPKARLTTITGVTRHGQKPADVPPGDKKPPKLAGGQVTDPGLPGLAARKPKIAIIKPAAPLPEEPVSAQPQPPRPVAARPATTRFGSRTAVPTRGKPRFLGLILTGILLFLLAVVAAWSSYYLTRNDIAPATETAVAAAPETAAEPAAQAVADVPAVDDEMLADQQDPADFAATATPDPAPTDAAPTDAAPTEPAPTEPAVAAVAAPVETPIAVAPETATVSADQQPPAAATGTPAEPAQDAIFLSTMESPPPALDPLSLPRPVARPDTAPAAAQPPPPFGTQYQFDENGLILATAEGVVTPEGVLLVSGRPSVVPPARPAAVAPAPTVLAPTALVDPAIDPATGLPTAAPAVPDQIAFPSDPAFQEFRPRSRPAGFAPPAATLAPEDDAALAPAADSRLAAFRPRTRPASVVSLAESARQATEAASLAAQATLASAAASEVLSDGPISPQAVAISRKPAARPADFSNAVQSAVAAAVQEAQRSAPEPAPEPAPVAVAQPAPAPEPEPEPTQVAAASTARNAPSPAPEPTVLKSPEEEDEPDVASGASGGPLKGTVAKQATLRNAINLSQTNLIGVYGTQDSRYAMIRQSNGRFKKVKVGDRIDGGTIAAITQTEVRYQKGGRMIALKMPKG